MTNANENPYYPVTLECRPRPESDFSDPDVYKEYVPCENLYYGYYDGGVVRIFFFRQGSPAAPERWSQTGPQTINLNKRAMVDDAMGKVFTYYAQDAATLESPSSTGAALWKYRVYDGKFAVNISTDEGPMYAQDPALRWIKLDWELYYDYLRGPRGEDGIYELPQYVYWRYQDGDNWTKVDTGVPFTPQTEEGRFLTDYGQIVSSYNFNNYVFHNDSANFPNGSSQIQFTAYNAEQFEFLEDYMSSQYPNLDPSTITIAKINKDGEFNTYPIVSIVDNGTYYTVTLDTTKDVVAAFNTDFEPDNKYTFRFNPHDTSSDPPGAVGTPYGTYSVRNGKWAVSAYAVKPWEQDEGGLEEWVSYGRGTWYHEHIWYWRYTDREIGAESAWTKHTQADGYAENVTHPGSSGPSLEYQTSSVEFYNKYNQNSQNGYTLHFQVDSEPANFPDGTRPIELTCDLRETDRLFVMFDRPGSKPRLVVDQTIKQEDFGSFYTKGTGTPPDRDAGFYDEATNTITYVDQSPNREGQVITYIAPGISGVASMFISVETSPGVFEWKGRG